MTKELTFPHVYQLEASAGSGKTFNLARRYRHLLGMSDSAVSAPADFRNILAITFTNEASGEMKERILKQLKAMALNDRRLLEEYHMPPPPARLQKKMLAAVEGILTNYSQFYIKTIDSFMHSVLVASSLQLRLPPYKEIADTAADYIEFAFDELCYESAGGDFEKLLGKFVDDIYLHFQERPNWYPRKELLEVIHDLYRKQNERGLEFNVKRPARTIQKIEKETKKVLARLFKRLETEQIGLQSRTLSEGLLNEEGRRFFHALFEQIQKVSTRKRIPENDKASATLKRTWKQLGELCGEAAEFYAFATFASHIAIFKKFEDYFRDFKTKKRVIFLDELNKIAGQFLRSADFSPPELFYKLSAVFYHYLVDEFQDTNRLQWENIDTLVKEALSEGGSLFYVGDRKQAIYRFRAGDITLFDDVFAGLAGRVASYADVLTENYRSLAAIVDFNNAIFGPDNIRRFIGALEDGSARPLLDEDAAADILRQFQTSRQDVVRKNAGPGYVNITPLAGGVASEREDETKERLLSLINGLRARRRLDEVMILVRRNEEVETVSGWLIGEGIPVYSPRTISIRENYLIREILSFLSFCHSPIDNLSFACFILGDIFTRRSRDYGIDKERLRGWLQSLRLEEGGGGTLYTRFRADFSGVWGALLEYFFKNVGFLPVYELLHTVLKTYRVFEQFPDQEAYFSHLLELTARLQEKGKNSLGSFLEYWKTPAASEDSEKPFFVRATPQSECVSVLTIHKAKGLESPVVILPSVFLDSKVDNKLVHSTGKELLLLYLKKDYTVSPLLRKMYTQEYTLRLLDELNALYVAFTRAKEELYAFIPEKKGTTHNKAFSLITPGGEPVERGKVPPAPSRMPAPKKEPLPGKPAGYKEEEAAGLPELIGSRIYEETLAAGTPAISFREVRRGDVIHRALSFIGGVCADELDGAVKEGIRQACIALNYPGEEEIAALLEASFRNDGFRQFFLGPGEAFTEKEIADRNGNVRRVDRLILDKTGATVLDYKTGDEREEDRAQMEDYKKIIGDIFPSRTVKGFLYYIEKNVLREV